MRLRKRLALVLAMALVGVAASAVTAGADVPRCQEVTVEYTVDYYLAGISGPFSQTFTVIINACDGTFEGEGSVPDGGGGTWVSWTEGNIDGTDISYTSTYDVESGYTVTVTGTYDSVTYNFVGEWSDNYSAGPRTDENVEGTATSSSESNYKNHGDYVAANNGPAAAHSSIGMPTVSNKNNNKNNR